MRKIITAAIAAITAAVGHAQSLPPLMCLPSQAVGGKGSPAVMRIVDSPIVACARWWCKPESGTGAWVEHVGAFGPTQFVQAVRDEYVQAGERGDSVWIEAHRTWQRDHPEFVRCVDSGGLPERSAAARPAPLYAYRVAVNSTNTTRPAYALVAGVRGTKEVGRAAVGAGCDPAKAQSGAYMAFAPEFAPTVVTLCK